MAQSQATVRYACRCGAGGGIEDMFYCARCDMVCCDGECSVKEAVAYYCPRCLVGFTASEALGFGCR